MEYYNNILCVSSKLLIKSDENPNGFTSYSNLHKMYRRAGKLTVVRHGKGKDNYLLIDFHSIPTDWQIKLKEYYPSPEAQAEAKPFKDRVVIDEAAKAFYRDEKIDGVHLPDRLKDEYTINASILNAVKELYDKAVEVRSRNGKPIRRFWNEAAKAVDTMRAELKHTLPKNHRYFQRVFNEYVKEGYISLISGRIGNKNSEKITGEILEWLTTEMAQGRQSIDMIAMRYPAVAIENNWELNITPMAFRKRVSQPEIAQMIALKRHGRKGFRKLFGHSFKLKNAQYANDIWVSDGTSLSWYYRVPVYGKTGKFLHYKAAMATTYVVMDACSNKFLGWSTKEGINKENFEMQLEAYRMALRNSGAKPYQLLFDNQGGHKNTESRDFYSKLARVFFPTRAYRPSGKAVERGFKNFQTLKLAEFPFWSGFGRPSHSNLNYAPNMEDIEKNVESLPDFEELNKLLGVTISEWNDLGFNGAKCPNAIYNEARNPEEQPVSVFELAEMFWNMQGPKKYYPWGINLIYKGEEITYEVYDDKGNVDYNFRRKYLKQKFFLKYDPDGEYPEIELYQAHPTGGYQKVANASKKREASRSVKYHNQGDKEWIERQMALESEMLDEMDNTMTAIGYSEEVKWTQWRNKIDAEPNVQKEVITLHGGTDEGTMDIIE